MSTTRLEVFDSTLQQSNEWLGDINAALGWGDRQLAYDVEWSRTSYPWHRAGRLTTHSTSAVLPLAPGRWWYRVRGIDDALPGSQAMSWSSAVPIRIAAPKFAVVGG